MTLANPIHWSPCKIDYYYFGCVQISGVWITEDVLYHIQVLMGQF